MEKVRKRSGGNCEAMITFNSAGPWMRCWGGPVEVHHVLPRSRGGKILDEAGEDYHLMAMCARCHHRAHEGELMIEGYVITENGRPVYTGPDHYLSARYPKESA
jgi:hypothetical protein